MEDNGRRAHRGTLDMKPSILKRQLTKGIQRWRDRLWLNQWKIEPHFEDEVERGETGAFRVAARAECDSEYRQADVTIALKVNADRSEEVKNRTLCHEMVHVRNSPVDHFVKVLLGELPPGKRAAYLNWWVNVDEGLTEDWCNILLDAYKELK